MSSTLLEILRDFADVEDNIGYTNKDRPVLSATELKPTKMYFSAMYRLRWFYLSFLCYRGLQYRRKSQFSSSMREDNSQTECGYGY